MRTILLILSVLATLPLQVAKPRALNDEAVRATMKKATAFMVEQVSNQGGYLWNYAPDFSRVWGELECKPSMMWIERGTPAMGNIFLDAWHATGDSYYLEAARQAAAALIWAQLPCGGWNYMADFAGEASLKDWYETVARGYASTATAEMIGNLMQFYRWTGDTKYLARIPDAFEFLESIRYSPEEVEFFGVKLRDGQILCPTFVEVGTGRPLYLHRGGGKYRVDYDPHDLITHYRSWRTINIGPLKEQFQALLAMSPEEATADSPFLGDKARQRRFRRKASPPGPTCRI